ncbi:excisionase [Burkholderia ambifaria]|uniref:excisionase n=1 Tax=Burkholderia ambifaria TaxID=152480 RepID=UPI00158E982B|nr:excisionase [Burkholderia ambifaria]
MSKPSEEHWVPLEVAAKVMKKSAQKIRQQMWNGSIQRYVHFRKPRDGDFEINIPAYLNWCGEEKRRRGLPLIERLSLAELDQERYADLIKSLQPPAEPEVIAPAPAAPPAAPAEPKELPRMIPIEVWAEITFGEYAPSISTLKRWVKQGHISPRPQKVGQKYFARREAEFIDTTEIRVRRMVGRYRG